VSHERRSRLRAGKERMKQFFTESAPVQVAAPLSVFRASLGIGIAGHSVHQMLEHVLDLARAGPRMSRAARIMAPGGPASN
jgi:hypothetical protein